MLGSPELCDTSFGNQGNVFTKDTPQHDQIRTFFNANSESLLSKEETLTAKGAWVLNLCFRW